MKKAMFFYWLIVFSAVSFAQESFEGRYYNTSRGAPIYLPIGKISFADRVVLFEKGIPSASERFSNPLNALNEPNYKHYKSPDYVSLGCGGRLTLEFTDNGFIDMEGADVYVWEVGPSKENFIFEISKDGNEWLSLGEIDGGKAFIDIAPVVTDPRDIFYFVRITDLKNICSGISPGVDIDAVGTISGVIKINLSADVLFDFNKFNLKPKSVAALDSLAYQIDKVGMAEIIVEGHTDNIGSHSYNLLLSEKRAQSVIDQLSQILNDPSKYPFKMEAHSFDKPRADNSIEAGRQLNRRVEIIVKPHRNYYQKKK